MTEASQPERIWVPGTLLHDDDGEIVSGRAAGYLGSGRAFRFCWPGRHEELGDRRHTVWLLERRALDDALIDDQAIILADRLVDPDLRSHAHRWLSEQPLVAVSGAKVKRLVATGRVRVFAVGIELHDGQPSLAASMAGPDGVGWSFEARLSDLEAAQRQADPTLGAAAMRRPAPILDRVLRQLSDGVLRESAVLAALQARELVEPGYGYHGCADGAAASFDHIQRAVRPLAELFGQIYGRAEDQRATAREIAAVLGPGAQQCAGLESVPVPHYGTAERVVEPELVIPTPGGSEGPSYLVGTQRPDRLVLPAVARWFVAQGPGWSPALPPELEQELRAAADRTGTRPSQWLVAVIVALLALLAVCAWWRLG